MRRAGVAAGQRPPAGQPCIWANYISNRRSQAKLRSAVSALRVTCCIPGRKDNVQILRRAHHMSPAASRKLYFGDFSQIDVALCGVQSYSQSPGSAPELRTLSARYLNAALCLQCLIAELTSMGEDAGPSPALACWPYSEITPAMPELSEARGIEPVSAVRKSWLGRFHPSPRAAIQSALFTPRFGAV